MNPPGREIPFHPDATTTYHLPSQPVAPPVRLLVLDPRDPMAVARQFIADNFTTDGHQGLYRYRGDFLKFSGACYRGLDDDTIRAEIWSYLERAYRVETAAYSPFKPKKGIVDNVVDALQAVCNLDGRLETPTWLGETSSRAPASEFLAVANGLLHLPTGELKPPSPLYFGIGASDVPFDSRASEPVHWLTFLHDLFGRDRDTIALLQDMMGYAIGCDTSLQKLMLFVGPPRSGKGTIGNVISALVGTNKVVGPTMASLGQNFGLAALIGKNLAIIGDARVGGRTDQAVIVERLLSISGEDTHTIDRKFKEPWTGRLHTRFIVMTNELPRLADSSGALANRFVPLVMSRSFLGTEDHGLQGRLSAEYPGILNWALIGYHRMRERRHFVQPASGLEAVRDLEELASPIKGFITQTCDLRGEVPCGALYACWQDYCQHNGVTPTAANVFGRDLRAALPAIKQVQRRADPGRYRVYVGISLKSESET